MAKEDDRAEALEAPAKGNRRISGWRVPGLRLRITSAGHKAWTLAYRDRQGGSREATIGDFSREKSGWTAARARKEAERLRALIDGGHDPLAERRAERQAAVAREEDKLSAVFVQFVERHLEAKHRVPRYIEECERAFRLHVKPTWGERDIKTIARREVIALLDTIRDGKVEAEDEKSRVRGGPIAANRTLALIRALFNFAVRRDILEASPVALVERPGAEIKRERALSTDELKILWPAMVALGHPAGTFLRFALLTGQRRGEIAAVGWRNIDETAKTWTLGAAGTKARRAHVVPLSTAALAVLKETEAGEGVNFVFAGIQRKRNPRHPLHNSYLASLAGGRSVLRVSVPLSGFNAVKRLIDAEVAKAGAKLVPWTIHDLRRTAATHMARLGISQFVISRVLNHADRSVTGAVYNQYEYLNEKRHALDTWGNFLAGLMKPADAIYNKPWHGATAKPGRP